MEQFDEKLIASCGMNCNICIAHLREKNKCPGCNIADPKKSKTCQNCKLKNCTKRTGRFCFQCKEFPCDKLKHLDKRYQAKYGMSEIENLEFIRDNGIAEFTKSQCQKYHSVNGTFCVHNRKYY